MRRRKISLDLNSTGVNLCCAPSSPPFLHLTAHPLPISNFPLSSLGHLFPSVSPSVHLSPSHSISLIPLLLSLHPKMSHTGIFQRSEFIHQLLPEFQLNLSLQHLPISYVVWLVFTSFLCSSPPPMVRIVTLGEDAVITYINICNLNMPTSQTHSALATAPVLSNVFPQLESRFLSAISASTIILILLFILSFQIQPSAFFHWNLMCPIDCPYIDRCETFFMFIRCKPNGPAKCYLLQNLAFPDKGNQSYFNVYAISSLYLFMCVMLWNFHWMLQAFHEYFGSVASNHWQTSITC